MMNSHTSSATDGLPPGWVSTTLGEVFRWGSGGTPTSTNKTYYGGHIPWLIIGDLDDKIVSTSSHTITASGLQSSSAKWVEVGSVLLAMYGSIGKLGIAGTRLTTNQAIAFTSPEPIEGKYLFYYLLGQRRRLNQMGSGATQNNISQTVIRGFPFLLAPLPEQHRIVAEIERQFSLLDAGVANLRRVSANLKRYRASVLQAACEGRLVPTEAALALAEGRSYEPADVLLTRILAERRARWEAEQVAKMEVQGKLALNGAWKAKYQEPAAPDTSKLRGLPEGWGWCSASQVCDFITKGTTPAAEKMQAGQGDVPFIKVYNLTNYGVLDFSVNPTFINQKTHQRDLARSKVFPGDILMNIVGPPLGKVSIVSEIYPEWNINQAIAIFRPEIGLDRKFLAYALLTEAVLFRITSKAKATAGQFNLTLEQCRMLPLPLPPMTEQERIVAEVERRLSVVDNLEQVVKANLKRAERLRQAILKEAFAGRLVPQNPADEPAGVLLERIKVARAANAGVGKPKRAAKKEQKAFEL
jgi:type I restriction enzyme S subunit